MFVNKGMFELKNRFNSLMVDDQDDDDDDDDDDDLADTPDDREVSLGSRVEREEEWGTGLISTKQNSRAGRSRPEVAVPLLGRSPSRKRPSSPPREERFVGAVKVENVRVIGHG